MFKIGLKSTFSLSIFFADVVVPIKQNDVTENKEQVLTRRRRKRRPAACIHFCLLLYISFEWNDNN